MGQLTSKCGDTGNLDNKARLLVDAAGIAVIPLYPIILEAYPTLRWIADTKRLPRWDYFMTVASVGVASIGLIAKAQERGFSHRTYSSIFCKKLEELRTGAVDDLAKFTTMVASEIHKETPGKLEMLIGKWVLCEIKELDALSDEELAASKFLGSFLCKQFLLWWD
jgi:hypothetical protein